MMKSFEDLQAYSKDGVEAMTASTAALTKGYQAVATEVADFSKKSFEKNAAVFEKAVASKSFERFLREISNFCCNILIALGQSSARSSHRFNTVFAVGLHIFK